LKDGNTQIRQQALFALGRTSGDISKALPFILPLLKDDNQIARRTALTTMGRCGEEALPHIQGALKDPDPAMRWSAALALKNTGPPAKKAAKELAELAKSDANITVRRNAASALAAFGSDSVPLMIDVWKAAGNDRSVRPTLVLGFSTLGPAAKDAVP